MELLSGPATDKNRMMSAPGIEANRDCDGKVAGLLEVEEELELLTYQERA